MRLKSAESHAQRGLCKRLLHRAYRHQLLSTRTITSGFLYDYRVKRRCRSLLGERKRKGAQPHNEWQSPAKASTSQDLRSTSTLCPRLARVFENTFEFQWLKENVEVRFIFCAIKRDKHILGIIYEPWHYRYGRSLPHLKYTVGADA